jgi:signal transduction histidine kinase
MASTDITAATRDGRSHRSRGRHRFHRGWRQALLDTVYIATGFALSIAWWTLLVVLIATGIGLAVTLVGIPILAATIYLWVALAQTERWRARLLLGLDIPSPYRAVEAGSFLASVFAPRVVWQRLKDPAVWRDLVYLLFVFLPLAIVTFAVAVSAWAFGLGLAAAPLAYWLGDGLEFGSSDQRADNLPMALGACALGIVVIFSMPWLMGALAAAHAATVRGLLRRSADEREEQLTRQRTEAVDAAVAERRRIERDLHDGAQQRLTALAIDLGRARTKLDSDPEAARALVEQAHEDAKQALAELRNLARGIHPAILTDRGLDAALSALAARSTVPVEITVDVEERPSTAIESTAYFVVAESLTNAAKHAAASRLRVLVRRRSDTLMVEVEDDGVGGARLTNGGGLEGLATRVATVDGSLTLSSPEGGPTVVHVELPCGL